MWVVDRQSVLSEILDGEAVIVDLTTGCYHAAAGVGATVWSGVVSGDSLEMIMSDVFRRHTDVPANAADAVDAFINSLVSAGLAHQTDNAATSTAQLLPENFVPTPWARPVLETHDDLADLMLIDPVHDVSTRGWPEVPSTDS